MVPDTWLSAIGIMTSALPLDIFLSIHGLRMDIGSAPQNQVGSTLRTRNHSPAASTIFVPSGRLRFRMTITIPMWAKCGQRPIERLSVFATDAGQAGGPSGARTPNPRIKSSLRVGSWPGQTASELGTSCASLLVETHCFSSFCGLPAD